MSELSALADGTRLNRPRFPAPEGRGRSEAEQDIPCRKGAHRGSAKGGRGYPVVSVDGGHYPARIDARAASAIPSPNAWMTTSS